MLKRERRDKHFKKYMDVETPKWEEQLNGWHFFILLIVACITIYLLITGLIYGMSEF